MSPSSPCASGWDAIVRRLRAAGCVFAEDEASLLIEAATSPAELGAMLDRRVAGLPIEHIIGWVEFCGLRVAVDPGVFVPRRRTELLVREAARLAPPGATIVDLACGTGAVGMVLATLVAGVRLYAVEIDPAAVRCARRNLAGLARGAGEAGADPNVYAGDLYEPLPAGLRGHVDVLVANVPYVPTSAVGLLPPEAREHEPLVALDGGADGLDLLRRVAAQAPRWLAPGGHVLMETGADQIDAALHVLASAGLTAATANDDDLYATIVLGRR